MVLNARHLTTPFSVPSVASVALLLCLVATTGCKQEHGADVVASVNGKAIGRGELDRAFADAQRSKQDPQPETEEQGSTLR